jgi:hypothetical protein
VRVAQIRGDVDAELHEHEAAAALDRRPERDAEAIAEHDALGLCVAGDVAAQIEAGRRAVELVLVEEAIEDRALPARRAQRREAIEVRAIDGRERGLESESTSCRRIEPRPSCQRAAPWIAANGTNASSV